MEKPPMAILLIYTKAGAKANDPTPDRLAVQARPRAWALEAQREP